MMLAATLPLLAATELNISVRSIATMKAVQCVWVAAMCGFEVKGESKWCMWKG